MKVLMFGWEFPPFNKGGLGTACYGLTKGLSNKNISVTFVAPRLPEGAKGKHVKLISSEKVKIKSIKNLKMKHFDSPMAAYMTPDEYTDRCREYSKSIINWESKRKSTVKGDIYGKNLFQEVERYAMTGSKIAKQERFDVIHAHDWLTYKAGIAAKKASGKPLVVHVHATEFDRTGGSGVNQYVYEIEREGMHESDLIIAVSNFTKNKIIEHYGIDPEKVHVVHNAVEFPDSPEPTKSIGDERIVLFLGRITLQKGPDYFVEAAKKVLEKHNNVKFIMAGSGDMQPKMLNRALELGIADKFLFAGFLRGKEIDKAYQMADVYVMPSVSEPFGITPLEAMRNNTPVIISKQSGVSEVINHCIKVDFWDTHELADKILGVLRFNELQDELRKNGSREVKKFNWDIPAEKCINVYNKALGGMS